MKFPDGWKEQQAVNTSEPKEVWKQYKNSPYEFSSGGHCRRKEKSGEYSHRKPRSDDRKHHRVNLTWDGHREEPLLHQVVMELFGPPKPKGKHIVILHKDDNGENNAISNLKWGSRSENVQSAYDSGLVQKGRREAADKKD